MTTLTIDVPEPQRRELSSQFIAHMGRVRGAQNQQVITALQAVGAALHGAESSVEIDLSALRAKDRQTLVNLLRAYRETGSHYKPVISFADAIAATL